ncbi:hypothetical protein [Lactobacillus ultunensis]|nr:hypothetical protein [Lactobacillus ultunensis]KRL82659.1 SAM-dependent methyltransferase [Lactobacillus ultunensis DSM 16047]QQP29410.1 SAM-dependent methyltransferase [Lactobacillus ultunensis]
MTKFLEKVNKLDQEINYSLIHEQVEAMEQVDHYVSRGKPLLVAPQRIGLMPDEFEDILTDIGQNKRKQLTDINNLFNNFRQYLSLKYGIWSIANLQTAKLIKKELNVNTALEIMAGNAYWSKALEESGIQTISTDSLEWAKTSKTGSIQFHPVINLSADQAIKKYNQVDLILCSWSPNFGKSDIDTVKSWQKYNKDSHLLFIGERNGATNSPEFWDHHWFKKTPALMSINHSFQSFDFIDERIFEINNEF